MTATIGLVAKIFAAVSGKCHVDMDYTASDIVSCTYNPTSESYASDAKIDGQEMLIKQVGPSTPEIMVVNKASDKAIRYLYWASPSDESVLKEERTYLFELLQDIDPEGTYTIWIGDITSDTAVSKGYNSTTFLVANRCTQVVADKKAYIQKFQVQNAAVKAVLTSSGFGS